MAAAEKLTDRAHAKINLTLRIFGKRSDGYHDLDSVVAFVDLADSLTMWPGEPLFLEVTGPLAGQTGPLDSNLVLKAVRALAARVGGLVTGRFVLDKHLPAGAGLGGGSADAAAALRLLARCNGLDRGDDRVVGAARSVGADVLICLFEEARRMTGIGDVLSEPYFMPQLAAVLAFPNIPLATKDVYAAFDALSGFTMGFVATSRAIRLAESNDLEQAAVSIAPMVGACLDAIRSCGSSIVGMSGSGSACFGLFASQEEASTAARALAAAYPDWWVRPTTLLGSSVQIPGWDGHPKEVLNQLRSMLADE
jgi:4-diphosphocytidyl-2-C-methyl-D-erythritol kinase